EEEAAAAGLGQPEGTIGAERAHLESLDGQLEIVDGRGGTREVQHGIEGTLDGDEGGHGVLHEDETRILDVGDVVERAGEEVVHADHLAAVPQEEVAEVRAEEAGPSRDEDPHARPQTGRTGFRPTEEDSKPRRRMRSGSQRLRPSTATARLG